MSLLPSVSKVFERIIHDQLNEYFSSLKLFYKSQYGFRHSHLTELAALELVELIITEMDVKKVPLNIYLDLSKAFDTLDHEILLFQLKHYGVKDLSVKLLQSYLTNRVQYVIADNIKSNHIPLQLGVPQGSILGPLLFIIYVNDLVKLLLSFIQLFILMIRLWLLP